MIIAALITFGALLACWLFAASDPDADRRATVAEASSDGAAPELAQAA
jgi:hypothetical protein